MVPGGTVEDKVGGGDKRDARELPPHSGSKQR